MAQTVAISETILNDILSAWRLLPLSADDFSKDFIKKRPGLKARGITKEMVADALRTTRQYILSSDAPSRHKGVSESFTNYEMARGSLCFLDSAYFPKGYIGCPWFVLVFVDAYSRTKLFQAHKKLTAENTAKALGKIIQRFKGGKVEKVISDRGSEVCALSSFIVHTSAPFRFSTHTAFFFSLLAASFVAHSNQTPYSKLLFRQLRYTKASWRNAPFERYAKC